MQSVDTQAIGRHVQANSTDRSGSLRARVVLTDWGANTEGLSSSRGALLQQLLLLSLVYDEVLIQDEVLALSKKLARWFAKGKDFDLLRKCLDVGAIGILTHRAYGSDDLAELAEQHPITARGKYIARVGTKEEKVFQPTLRQELFHRQLDEVVRRPSIRRPVGLLDPIDVMASFGTILTDVLTGPVYARWLREAFRGPSSRVAAEFVNFIRNPEDGVRALRAAGKQPRTAIENGRIVFNRSLAYQLSELYEKRTARALKKLAASTFVVPFCRRERALGRFSRDLREVLWLPDSPAASGILEESVTVEATITTKLLVPQVGEDFVDAIGEVRQSEAGKQLRRSVRHLGQAVTFDQHVAAWKGVSEELATRLRKSERLTARSALVKIGKHSFYGTIAEMGIRALSGEALPIPPGIAGPLLGGGLGLCFDHGYALLRNDLQRQELRRALEKAVEFRCSSPPALTFRPETG